MIEVKNQQTVNIQLIANAGVVAEYNGIRFLIDGLQGETDTAFSKIPEDILKDMLAGKGKLSNIDYILFSHEHPDHFAPRYVCEYLKNNEVRAVFLPGKRSGDINVLTENLKENTKNCQLIELQEKGAARYKLRDDIFITAFAAVHMGPQFADIVNYCYLLTLGTKSILFTADADYKEENFTNALAGVCVDAVFVNPLFFNNPAGRRIIEKTIKPGKVIIYHIPFEEDNTFLLRKMVLRDIGRFKNDVYETNALLDEGQSVDI